MAEKEVTFEGYEYRVQGGELQRRPIYREGLAPWQGAWLVMNQDSQYVPELVLEQFVQPPAQLRFD